LVEMKTLLRSLAAGAATTLAAIAQAPAQQSPIDPLQPQLGQRSAPPPSMISVRALKPDQVRQIQQALKDRGIYKGAVTGIWNPATAAALHEFVATQDSQSGIRQGQADRVDPRALTALLPAPDQGTASVPSAPINPRRGSAGRPPSVSPGGPPSGTRFDSPPASRPSSPGTSH
jgi:peptidoglycan hydrolase-like protein with peptidoglycan-binding domain